VLPLELAQPNAATSQREKERPRRPTPHQLRKRSRLSKSQLSRKSLPSKNQRLLSLSKKLRPKPRSTLKKSHKKKKPSRTRPLSVIRIMTRHVLKPEPEVNIEEEVKVREELTEVSEEAEVKAREEHSEEREEAEEMVREVEEEEVVKEAEEEEAA
jgi:hypothetical protein